MDIHWVSWTPIALGEGVGTATRFFTISPTDRENEWATTARGGLVYVLCGAICRDQARLYRFTIEGLTGDAQVSNSTVQPLPDYILQNHPSFLYSRGIYRNYFATDGAMMMMARSNYYPDPSQHALLELLPSTVRSGFSSYNGHAARVIQNSGSADPLMGPLAYRTADGSWLAAGSRLMAND
ncbi:MAG: hypothetical protein HC888_18065 [Candidatus Competibacteraceae bacterium]|nr:hypothetical protein [Candidatus Competibacteraceae bacterium]